MSATPCVIDRITRRDDGRMLVYLHYGDDKPLVQVVASAADVQRYDSLQRRILEETGDLWRMPDVEDERPRNQRVAWLNELAYYLADGKGQAS